MTGFHPENHNSASRSAESHHDGLTGDDGELPPSPNVEHPRHDQEGARRAKERLDGGGRTVDDLSAREYGLLAYWYPSVLFDRETTGGRND